MRRHAAVAAFALLAVSVVAGRAHTWHAASAACPGARPGCGGSNAAEAACHDTLTGADDARIARVEQGLLPGIVIAGRATAPMKIADRMSYYKTPGVSVAVITDGRIEWARGYGVADADAGTTVTPRTRFQAASISKSVAAFAAMRLVDQGRLALDEDVNARLRSWKVPDNDFTKTRKVTLRALLNHSAGLTVHGFPGYASGAAVPTLVEVLDGVKPANTPAIRVDVEPGSLWRYSGGGYTVLQQLVIDVTGKPFAQAAAELALGPIGMVDSTYEQPLPERFVATAASGHLANGLVLPGKRHTYPELAAAGLWTTPTDLARFAIEIERAARGQSKLLSRASAQQMVTTIKGDYGLGLQLSGTGKAARFAHGGSNAGFRCQLLAFLETGQGGVVMTNGDGGGRLAMEILRAAGREYGWLGVAPKEKTLADVSSSALRECEGRYQLAPNRVVTVTLESGRLVLQDRAQRIELYPESATRFFELVEETELEFVKDANGAVAHVVINGGLRAPRVPST